VEISYDGSTWQDVRLMDDDNFIDHAMDATTINDRFTKSDPKAAYYGDLLYLRPIPSTAIAGGLRVWYIKRPTQLSNATSTLNVPSDYTGYLAYGVASEIAFRQGELDSQKSMLVRWEDGLEEIRKTFAPRAFGQVVDFKERPCNWS
jgi:hypothetical protein